VSICIFTFLSLSHHCKALNSLLCADVPLRNYSLTHSLICVKGCIVWNFASRSAKEVDAIQDIRSFHSATTQ